MVDRVSLFTLEYQIGSTAEFILETQCVFNKFTSADWEKYPIMFKDIYASAFEFVYLFVSFSRMNSALVCLFVQWEAVYLQTVTQHALPFEIYYSTKVSEQSLQVPKSLHSDPLGEYKGYQKIYRLFISAHFDTSFVKIYCLWIRF